MFRSTGISGRLSRLPFALSCSLILGSALAVFCPVVSHGAEPAVPALPPAPLPPDPTQPNAELKALLAAEDQAKSTPHVQALPQITVKGRVLNNKRSPALAMLAISDKTALFVRAGREYPLGTGVGAVQNSFIVRSIDADQVEIELRPTGQKLILP